jgi:hypothetical protein
VPGRPSERYFASHPSDGLNVRPNGIVALDHHGRLLGRQHYNDGEGRFGAFDGLHDRKMRACPDARPRVQLVVEALRPFRGPASTTAPTPTIQAA